ncbi:MAG: hypothetical protein PF447_01445, partial [Spirochaetaceae bacterium]|nr:hypothetical protein [Spirochaetaceae bacterium]
MKATPDNQEIELLLSRFNCDPLQSLERSSIILQKMNLNPLHQAHLYFISGSSNQLLLRNENALDDLN